MKVKKIQKCIKILSKVQREALSRCHCGSFTGSLWKSSGKTSEKAGNHLLSIVGSATGNAAVTDMWKNHFATLLNKSKNSENGNFWNKM